MILKKSICTYSPIIGLSLGLAGISQAAVTITGPQLGAIVGTGSATQNWNYTDDIAGALGTGVSTGTVAGGANANGVAAIQVNPGRVSTSRIRLRLDEQVTTGGITLTPGDAINTEFTPGSGDFVRFTTTLSLDLPVGLNGVYLDNLGGPGFMSDDLIWSVSWTGVTGVASITGNPVPNTTNGGDSSLWSDIATPAQLSSLTSGQAFRIDNNGVFTGNPTPGDGPWRINLPDGVTGITVTATADDEVYNTGQFANEEIFINFDEASLVPEPSSILLLSLASLFTITRRKR